MRRGAAIYKNRPATPRTDPGVLLPMMTRRQEVILVLALALAVRLVDIGAPFTSQHWIKQLQIAPIARNFATHSMNILWPETDYSADRPGYIEIEFQLVTWLSAVLYKFVGIHEWAARLVTIGFSMGTLVLFYRLALLFIGPMAASYALLFLAFIPTNWYFSRVLMSEPLMLFFSVALVYTFALWLRSGSRKHYLLAALSGALCFLVKLPTVFLVIPLAYLAWLKFGRRLLAQRSLWLLAALTLLPAAAYYAHAAINIGHHYFTVGVGFGGGMWFSLSDFTKPGNWALFADRFVTQHFTALGFVLIPLGLLALDKDKPRVTLFHVWFLATVAYFIVVSGGNLRQNYYQIHFMPPAAALFGLGWEQLRLSRRFSKHLDPILAALFIGLCVWGVKPMYAQYRPIRAAATELNLLDKTRAPVIIGPAGYGCLYYFNRPGWVGREHMGKPEGAVPLEDQPGPEYITSRIRRGAHWAVYFDVHDDTGQPEVLQFLHDTYQEVGDNSQGYYLFDLTHPLVTGAPKAAAATPAAAAARERATQPGQAAPASVEAEALDSIVPERTDTVDLTGR